MSHSICRRAPPFPRAREASWKGVAMAALLAGAAPWAQAQEGGAPRAPERQPAASDADRPAPYSAQAHDALVADWRAGRARGDQVFATLRGWAQELPAGPERVRVVADALVVGHRVALDRQVVALAASQGGTAGEGWADYALPALLAACRAVRQTELQGRVIARMEALLPGAWEPAMRRVQWMIDAGQQTEAGPALEALQARAAHGPLRQRLDVLELRAARAEAQGDLLQAVQWYEAELALDPDNAYAQHARVAALLALRAPGALSDDARDPQGRMLTTLGPLDRQRIALAGLAARLRWAVASRDQHTGAARFEALNALDADYARQDAGMRAAAGADWDTPAWKALRASALADRMQADREREQPEAIEQLAARAQAEGLPLPYYGKAALAWAHVARQEARVAAGLYDEALREGGSAIAVPSDLYTDTVYAYVDAGRFDDADRMVAWIAARTPRQQRLAPVAGTHNAQYDEVQQLRANTLLYSDRLAQAEQAYAALVEAAPGNVGFAAGAAQAQAMRQRPERARALYRALLTDHPESREGRAGYAHVLMESGDMGEAREQIAQLRTQEGDSMRVQRMEREYAQRAAAYVQIDMAAGRDGGTLANDDRLVDTRLYSPLLRDHWRLFAHHVWASGTYDDQRPLHGRVGLGAQWVSGPWAVQGELNQSLHGRHGNATGVALDGSYRLTDAWQIHAAADTNVVDVPWRGWDAGVTGKRYEAGVRWAPSESRRVEGSYSQLRLGDGNRGHEWVAGWEERWYSGPVVQFGTRLSVTDGGFGRQDVAYFSPEHYTHVRLGGRLQVLTWKDSDRRMMQTLEVGVGSYRQRGYGSQSTLDVRYQHDWALSPVTGFYYGVSWADRPFDGVKERRRALFAGLTWALR